MPVRRFFSPKEGTGMNPVRPTSSKLVQTLFNIIGVVDGGSFLDLFSGTGRVAFEAANHGFETIVAVELDRRACQELKNGPMSRKADTRLEVLCMDIRRAMVLLAKKGRLFDVIFADPPYESGWVEEITRGGAFLWLDLLAAEGVFVLEHSSREKIPDKVQGLAWETRQYGDSCLSFYRKGKRSEAE
jgi:16S rRNA (guanine966-N2)-methyltransferase